MTEKTALAEMIESSRTSKVEYCKFEKRDVQEYADGLIEMLEQNREQKDKLCQETT